jgi:SH3-like domain-containing protein
VPSKVANGTPFNQKLHLISRSAQGTIPKFTSAKQVNLNVRPSYQSAMTILRFRYADTSCPVSMIAAMRSLTGLSIADIKNRIATSQPLFEIVAFRND